ncbi:MAG: YggS family pyridoxal phosphate enzyme [Crocinitomicaceae bacterium TMED16]|nr:MAG: YggS family pyridoxal phosphate enzyme [Crocinitomicaceae bacterium TMED16]|tara:strand:+ start:570 stop:1232 length:663 start_codon:yes stop_codon:yes gene_type:complete
MIGANLNRINKELPKHVVLVAVSKTKPIEDLQEAFDAGQRIFGENKVQEMAAKWEVLPKEIEWHFIGHLQRNKVKYLAPFVSLIHGVESLRLLKEVNKQALKSNRIIDVLLQFYIADEETKFGLSEEEANDLLNSEEYKLLKNIQIRGVMGMATFTKDQEKIKGEFHKLKKIHSSLKANHFSNNHLFDIVSMGMSGDYETAIDEGSTMIRIGSSIFGARN